MANLFGARMEAALRAAEAATGAKRVVTDTHRDPMRQAQYYADYTGRSFTYRGQSFSPQKKGGLAAAPPGLPTKRWPKGAPGSRHQIDEATDLGAGPVRNWVRAHARQFGLETIPNDAPHIQLARGIRTTRYDGHPIPPADIPNPPPTADQLIAGRGAPSAGLGYADTGGPAAPGGPPTLRKGATDAKTGGAVTRLQQQLAAVPGGPPVAVDGKYGPQTEAAVRAVEKQYGLTQERPGKAAAGPQVQAALAGNERLRTVTDTRQRFSDPLPGPAPLMGYPNVGQIPAVPGAPPSIPPAQASAAEAAGAPNQPYTVQRGGISSGGLPDVVAEGLRRHAQFGPNLNNPHMSGRYSPGGVYGRAGAGVGFGQPVSAAVSHDFMPPAPDLPPLFSDADFAAAAARDNGPVVQGPAPELVRLAQEAAAAKAGTPPSLQTGVARGAPRPAPPVAPVAPVSSTPGGPVFEQPALLHPDVKIGTTGNPEYDALLRKVQTAQAIQRTGAYPGRQPRQVAGGPPQMPPTPAPDAQPKSSALSAALASIRESHARTRDIYNDPEAADMATKAAIENARWRGSHPAISQGGINNLGDIVDAWRRAVSDVTGGPPTSFASPAVNYPAPPPTAVVPPAVPAPFSGVTASARIGVPQQQGSLGDPMQVASAVSGAPGSTDDRWRQLGQQGFGLGHILQGELLQGGTRPDITHPAFPMGATPDLMNKGGYILEDQGNPNNPSDFISPNEYQLMGPRGHGGRSMMESSLVGGYPRYAGPGIMSEADIANALQSMIEGPPVGPQDNISDWGRPANQSATFPSASAMGMRDDYGTGIPRDKSLSDYGALPARFDPGSGYVPFRSGAKPSLYASAGAPVSAGGPPLAFSGSGSTDVLRGGGALEDYLQAPVVGPPAPATVVPAGAPGGPGRVPAGNPVVDPFGAGGLYGFGSAGDMAGVDTTETGGVPARAPGGVPYATDPMRRTAGFTNIGNGVVQTPVPKPSLGTRIAGGVLSAGANAVVPGLGLLVHAIFNSASRGGGFDNAQPYRGATGGNYATAAPNPYGGFTTGSSYSASPFTPSGSGWNAPSFSSGSGGSLNAWRANPNDPGHGTYIDSHGNEHPF